jgi:hypothetical protein
MQRKRLWKMQVSMRVFTACQLEASPDPPSAVAKPKQVKEKKISIGDLSLKPYKPTTHLESVNVPRTKVDPTTAHSNKHLVPAKLSLSESQMKHRHWY